MGKNNHEHHEKLLKNVSDDSKAKLIGTTYSSSWIKGTIWGTLGFDPRFLKGSVKSFYHAKMLVGAY